jgi:archaellum component FlaF (FlaF/FlaG flagellin family)
MSDKDEKKNVHPILKKLGVKIHNRTYINRIRIILFLIVVGYIIYMAYDDYKNQEENEQLMKSIFTDDDKFFKKLTNMDDKLRNRYLKAVKQSFDANNTLQSKLYNKLKSSITVAILSEFLLSGNHIESISGLGSTILNNGMGTVL